MFAPLLRLKLCQWTQIQDIELEDQASTINSLSWGSQDEILLGSSYLTLLRVIDSDAPEVICKRQLAHPTKLALFSHDAAYIASIGLYDRILKIWRRLSFDTDDVRFDISYLPHPATVSGIRWRQPRHKEQNLEHLLYTFCVDNTIRIWAATDPHSVSSLQLWHTINMNEVLQPRNLGMGASRRYAFVLDSRDFAAATERAIQNSSGRPSDDHALDHLIEIANRSPEICVVLDTHGHMSAWGLENAGCKTKTPSNVFNISHVEGLDISFDSRVSAEESFATFLAFNGGDSPDSITILLHHFDGQIVWHEAKIARLFDASSRQKQRVETKAVWSGHDGFVKKINRNLSGNAILSRTDENHGIVWKQMPLNRGPGLIRHSNLQSNAHIHRSCILYDGDLTALLHHDSVSLWDTSGLYAKEIDHLQYSITAKPLCLLSLPGAEESLGKSYLAVIGADAKGIVWEIQNPSTLLKVNGRTHNHQPAIREFCSIDLNIDDNIAFVLPVDPAGSTAMISGFVDVFALDVALTYSTAGTVRMLTAKVEPEINIVEWLVTCTIETGIQRPSLASGSSIRKVALVDHAKTSLTIWDTTGAQLEYDEQFSKVEIIKDLDWTSTPDNQSVLAVGFPHRILLLSQLRYDYLNGSPAWAAVREIRIKELTPHPIGDSCWLGAGHLVIGAGTQLFTYDQQMVINDRVVERIRLPARGKSSTKLFEVVRRLNGSLSVFHPQFLAQCVLCGKGALVQKILTTLHRKLKFWSEGDEIDTFLDLPLEAFIKEDDIESAKKMKELMSSYSDLEADDELLSLTEESAATLNDNLARKALPQLTSQEQFHLADIVECIATVEKQKRSMDENAGRYLVFFRQQILRRNQLSGGKLDVSWREINWAYHSNSQDIIVDMVSRHFVGKLLWEHARETGIFMFLTDNNALKQHLETIARNEYTKNDDRSPIDCSLYYLALRKKTVLSGLWRMAQGFREQGPTIKLLANDFNEPRWKTAALKNAYALLSKRRFHYAAAFFLLGDSLTDAVSVCMNQLDDLQLAVTIARAYEGDDGPVLRDMLGNKVLPQASQTGNRWLASWAFWMLNSRDKAVRSLISPIHTLLDSKSLSADGIPLQSRSYLSNDPALVVLYQQLRQKTLQALKGATMIHPREEWEFLVRNARLYSRMGCDLLALDLVRNFEFLKLQPMIPYRHSTTSKDGKRFSISSGSTVDGVGGTPDPRRLLRRRSSLVVADMPSPATNAAAPDGEGLLREFMTTQEDHHHTANAKSAKAKQPPPTVFEEPSGDSLLDSFGF